MITKDEVIEEQSRHAKNGSWGIGIDVVELCTNYVEAVEWRDHGVATPRISDRRLSWSQE